MLSKMIMNEDDFFAQFPHIWHFYLEQDWTGFDPSTCYSCIGDRFEPTNFTLIRDTTDPQHVYYGLLETLNSSMNSTSFLETYELIKCRLAFVLEMISPKSENWNPDVCRTFFDGLLCWPESTSGTTVSLSCPREIDGISYDHTANATRDCFENGTWAAKANYNSCAPTGYLDDYHTSIPEPHIIIMYYMYWVGYGTSLIFSLIALTIFLRFKALWCLRNVIHCNLILCFALHNITWILYSIIGNEIMTKHHQRSNLDYCVIPTSILKFFTTAGFFWMFVEGLYLFVSIMFSFQTGRIRFWMCAALGWVVPLFLITTTSVVKAHQEAIEECWNELFSIDYIFIGPVLALLFINLLFLGIIMYVVFSKLQVTVRVEAKRYRKTIKALFILCPLLGVNYILVLVSPSHPIWLKISFSYFVTLMSSLQGSLVAVFFCFLSNEVMHVLKQSCKHTMDRWKFRRLDIFTKYTRVPPSAVVETPREILLITIEMPTAVKTPQLAHLSSEFSDSQVCL